ncbi:MAG: flagellar hook-associated protein FlgK, partial [Rhizobiales bacterium]|nr:flagellar hook-associated protein FlgK [Hyphomicrobiales bacterium]
AYDQRDRILKQLADEIGIRTIQLPGDDIEIYTDSGVTLFEKHPRTVAFNPTNAFSPTTGGGAVYVDGVAVTGSNAALPIKSGRLAGLSELRDVTTVTYQTQMDELARGVIEAFAETDPGSPAALPPLTGLFTYSGEPNLPASGVHYLGMAAEIRVNAAVDPAQGGSPALVRDGGINGAAYVQNTTGAAGFNDNILSHISELSNPRTYDAAATIDTSDSITGYAASSVSWIEQTRSTVQQDADYRATLKAHTAVTLSNATGVNVDEEMALLLELERSFEASARLISAIDQMYASLLQAAG